MFSKTVVFINIYFHQTQPARGNRSYLNSHPLKYIVPYPICFDVQYKEKETFFNKSIDVVSHNMYKAAMDTTPKPL